MFGAKVKKGTGASPVQTDQQKKLRAQTLATNAVTDTNDNSEIPDSDKAKEYLERKSLLIMEQGEVTTATLANCLHQVANTIISSTAKYMVRAVAVLLEEVCDRGLRESIRELILSEVASMAEDLTSVVSGLKTNLDNEMQKHVEKLTKATKSAEATLTLPTGAYKSALISAPAGADPRCVARQGIKARQVVIDFAADSRIHEISQVEILKLFNKALEDAGAEQKEQRFRSVERLERKGVLGEFLNDNGAKWFHDGDNANNFFEKLGEMGAGALVPRRTVSLIAFFVPLSFNVEELSELHETNYLKEGTITKARWAKHPSRRHRHQQFGHLILSATDVDDANSIMIRGLQICGKKVSVGRNHKEPIRCLKCQRYGHIAARCTGNDDICGTCGEKGHRLVQCQSKDKRYCVSCDTNTHSSWDRDCPALAAQIERYNEKHPENTMPFFPSAEPWTWAAAHPQPGPTQPPIPYHTDDGPPVEVRNPTQKLRQQQFRTDYGKGKKCQQEYGSQPQFGASPPQENESWRYRPSQIQQDDLTDPKSAQDAGAGTWAAQTDYSLGIGTSAAAGGSQS